MSVINQNLLLTPEGYQISRSVRLRSSASAYFNRTPASAGNRKTWTWSGWVKRGTLGVASRLFAADDGSASTDQDYNTLLFNSSNQLQFSGNLTDFRITTAVYRDPSAWYHIVLATDTTQATAANRFKLYVNGSEVTAFGTSNNPSQNTDLAVNASIGHYIGSIAGSSYLDGYLTDINFIDGQALTPSSFGETDVLTGVWKPKKYAGTYGTNGFYLNFSDNSAATAAAIGKDSSGNGNNWTPNNISVTAGVTYDSMLDVPTMWADGGNGRGNYCTLNPIATNATVSNGNLTTTSSTQSIFGTIGVSSGKWYWEFTMTALTGTSYAGIFYSDGTFNPALGGAWSSEVRCYRSSGNKYDGSDTAYAASYTTNDVIGVALDLDSGTLSFYKNGTAQGTAFSSGLTGKTWYPFFYGQAGSNSYSANFGQRPFAYTPPTGFKALNTQNLPEPTIKKGNQYFDASLYTGTNASLTITNSGSMQPDLVWVKVRSQADQNVLCDAVRGVTKRLYSNLTNAEDATGGLVSINSSGFVLGDAATSQSMNNSGQTYVAWQWKESASAGFDIVTYTGTGSARTVSHSLGVAPSMMIIKSRSSGTPDWMVYHKNANASPQNGGMFLNRTDGFTSDVNYFNNTAPTSSVFTVNSNDRVNFNTYTYVAYLFAEVAGFSKFGSYTGNGSADGPFVYCGFRPRYVMIKRADVVGSWWLYDTSRSTYNAAIQYLFADTSGAEVTDASEPIDFLSNGFKLRVATYQPNTSGGTFIYAAFAENPFKNSLAR